MELTNEFRVGLPVGKAWAVLTDLERIAPCMPGAELQEVEGDEYRGVVKVKVGPITAQYKGKANWVERDVAAHRAVARAEGRETRGQGNASATITATLTPDGDGTRVDVATDLTITGRVASFGRGVLADVSAKLLQQFVDALEADLSREGNDDAGVALPAVAVPDAAGAASDAGPAVRRIESRPAQPVNLTEAAGPAVAKRVAPFVAGLFLLYWLVRRRRRRRG